MAEEKIDGLRADLTLDIEPYRKELVTATKYAKVFASTWEKSTNQAQGAVNNFAQSLQGMTSTMSALRTSASSSVSGLSQEFTKLAETLGQPKRALMDLRDDLKKIQVKQLVEPISQDVLASIQNLTATVNQAAEGMDKGKTSMLKSQTAIRRSLTNTVESYRNFADETQNSATMVSNSMQLMVSAQKEAKSAIQSAHTSIRRSLKATDEAFMRLGTHSVTSMNMLWDALSTTKDVMNQFNIDGIAPAIAKQVYRANLDLDKLRSKMGEASTSAKDFAGNLEEGLQQAREGFKATSDAAGNMSNDIRMALQKAHGANDGMAGKVNEEARALKELAQKIRQEAMQPVEDDFTFDTPGNTIPSMQQTPSKVIQMDTSQVDEATVALERLVAVTSTATEEEERLETAARKTAASEQQKAKAAVQAAAGVKRTIEETKKAAQENEKATSSFQKVKQAMHAAWTNAGDGISQYISKVQRATEKMNELSQQSQKSGKDVMNVFKGIVLAQGFYRSINALQGSVGSMWDMANAVETTSASMNILIKDMEKASQLSDYLQDFAAASEFTYDTASKATRQLLAYGFQLENAGYLMNVIGDAASAMGDPEAFNSVVKALGQMQTKGKVATQEILQLTEAGIPAYQILQEELGLTQKQLGNLGREGISATTAIEALLVGMEKRFKGSMNAMSQTVPGLWNNFKESVAAIGAVWMQPLHDSVKKALQGATTMLGQWVETTRNLGLGGLFETLVPDPMIQEGIRQLIANMAGLAQSAVALYQAFAPAAQQFSIYGMELMNTVLPALQGVLGTLTYLTETLFQNEYAVKVVASALMGLMVYKTVAGVMNIATTAAKGFAAGLAVVKGVASGGLAVGPMIASVSAIIASFSALFGVLNKANASLGKAMGNNPSKYLQPQLKKSQTAATDFNKTLSQTSDKTQGIADDFDKMAGSAKKARDAVASFDEVFELPDEDTGGGGGGGGGFDAPEIDIPEFDYDAMFPDPSALMKAAEAFQENYERAVKRSFDPKGPMETAFGNVIQAFKEIGETLSGVFLGIGASLTKTVVEIVKAIGKTIEAIFKGDFKSIEKIWDEAGANIKVSWAKTGSNIAAETAKAMKIIKNSTRSDLDVIMAIYDKALKELPNMTDTNMKDVAKNFMKHWHQLDEESLTVLRGTSDSMAVLFEGINKNMTKDEAQKRFVENLKTMKNSGMTEMNALTKDVSKAMSTISNNTRSEGDRLQDIVEQVFGTIKTVATADSDYIATNVIYDMEQMGVNSVEALQLMGGDFGRIFEGIAADADLNSADTKQKVIDNIDKMRRDGTWNMETMEANIANIFLQMGMDADERVRQLASYVDNGTLDAAKFAGANADMIRENIDQALSLVPGESKANIDKMRDKMIDGLVATGVLTKAQATDMRRKMKGELDPLPGDVTAILNGIKSSVRNNSWSAGQAWANAGWADGDNYKRNVLGQLEFAMSEVDRARKSLNDYINTKNSINFQQRPNMSGISVRTSNERGGLITRETLSRLGEHDRPEAVLPLTNRQAMTEVGSAIASHMAGSLAELVAPLINTTPGTSGGSDLRPVYVGTLIADDQGLRELQRKLDIIEVQENGRRGW